LGAVPSGDADAPMGFRNSWSGFPNSFLDSFVEKGFGLDSLRSLQVGYVSFIVLRLKVKPTSETDT
jgi:hypothetical protein